MVEIVPFLNFLQTIGVLATLIFVLTSRLWMGLSLTVPKIFAPLYYEGLQFSRWRQTLYPSLC
jgi:hypothetical protein